MHDVTIAVTATTVGIAVTATTVGFVSRGLARRLARRRRADVLFVSLNKIFTAQLRRASVWDAP